MRLWRAGYEISANRFHNVSMVRDLIDAQCIGKALVGKEGDHLVALLLLQMLTSLVFAAQSDLVYLNMPTDEVVSTV